jgi:hypothetical protein
VRPSEAFCELWDAADQRRANSRLTAAQCSMLVLGLIFLRHADNRFKTCLPEIEAGIPPQVSATRRATLIQLGVQGKAAHHLPEEARSDRMASLPRGADLGQVIDQAMDAVETEHEVPEGALPRGDAAFEPDLPAEGVKILDRPCLVPAPRPWHLGHGQRGGGRCMRALRQFCDTHVRPVPAAARDGLHRQVQPLGRTGEAAVPRDDPGVLEVAAVRQAAASASEKPKSRSLHRWFFLKVTAPMIRRPARQSATWTPLSFWPSSPSPDRRGVSRLACGRRTA